MDGTGTVRVRWRVNNGPAYQIVTRVRFGIPDRTQGTFRQYPGRHRPYQPEFIGSEKTTEFIRIVDKLFDLMNSKTAAAKGYKHPMNLCNFESRKEWLLDTKKYLEALKDNKGQPLCMGRRKTAWVGFMVTIDSVLNIVECLLKGPESFRYVLTFKMSQDHLEMFFSRVCRRGGWNTNPNCLQFKWALRCILMRNSIMPSKNANVSVAEPVNNVFQAPSAAVRHTNEQMQRFAELLSEPSEFHDHILHYMAGYITRHVVQDCKCTQCCLALQRDSSSEPTTQFSLLTTRKDRGGLIKPREDVFRIIQTTDKILRYGVTKLHIYLLTRYI